jgi:hypothetical protein
MLVRHINSRMKKAASFSFFPLGLCVLRRKEELKGEMEMEREAETGLLGRHVRKPNLPPLLVHSHLHGQTSGPAFAPSFLRS